MFRGRKIMTVFISRPKKRKLFYFEAGKLARSISDPLKATLEFCYKRRAIDLK